MSEFTNLFIIHHSCVAGYKAEVGCFFSFSFLLGPPTYFNPLASSRNKEVIPKFPPLNLGLAEGLATLS